MYTFLLVAAATLAIGLSTWVIERRRHPDRAFRIGAGAALAIACILGLGFVGERIVPADWHNAGLAAGLIAGALLAAALTGKLDLGKRQRRAN